MLDCGRSCTHGEDPLDPIWRDQLEGLKRFNDWEAEQLRRRPPDYTRTLAWLAEAWEFAGRYGPAEDPAVRRERHLQDLLHLRRALERARIRP